MGISMAITCGMLLPLSMRSSTALSRFRESDALGSQIGWSNSISLAENNGEDNTASLAFIQITLALIVLISPL